MGILFMTNYYLPKPLANGVCVHQLAKEVVFRGENVYVICYQRGNEKKEDNIDGVKILRVSLPLYHRLNFFFGDHRDSIRGKVAGLLSTFLGRIKKLLHIFQYPLRDPDVVKKYVKIAEKLISSKQISTIVGVYTPVEGIKAGAILKKRHPEINSVYYSLDTLSNEEGFGIIPKKIREALGTRLEKKLFSIYDKILLMNCHKNHYDLPCFSEFKTKFRFADFPLFLPKNDQNVYKNSKKIVYTGSLSRHIRNPQPTLELLKTALNVFSLHFYGYGDCDDIIASYSMKYPNSVVNHGFVSHIEAQKALEEADVLLSIGNNNTSMVPSKIYEYISTGKPIIHTFSSDEDPCLPVLKKYGNALCVRTYDDRCEETLSRFLSRLSRIDAKVIAEKFHTSTPEYTVNLLER